MGGGGVTGGGVGAGVGWDAAPGDGMGATGRVDVRDTAGAGIPDSVGRRAGS